MLPGTWAGLPFDATGSWLPATVSEGHRGELLAWRQGMLGPALVTRLQGPLMGPPPLLPVLSWWRTGQHGWCRTGKQQKRPLLGPGKQRLGRVATGSQTVADQISREVKWSRP